jgi:hypothetical protein
MKSKTATNQDALHDAAIDALQGRSHAQALRVFVTTVVKQRKLLDALALPYLQQVADSPGEGGDVGVVALEQVFRSRKSGPAMSMQEVLELKPPPRSWGGWQLNKAGDLAYTAPQFFAGEYTWELERLRSTDAMLDLIMQVDSKIWATDACLAGLVRALNDIFDPQSGLVRGGETKFTQVYRAALRGLRGG